MADNVPEEALKQSRARRAEEWEKVRHPDVITEKDREEDFEEKTLYERLQENRELKRIEIEEQFRYKNMVYSGLDNDEHKFLEAWENSKKEGDKARQKEECEELQKFKARVVDLDSGPVTLTASTVVPITERKVVSKQKKMLSGIVKKRKSEVLEREEVKSAKTHSDDTVTESTVTESTVTSGGLTGLLGAYSSSSESDSDNT